MRHFIEDLRRVSSGRVRLGARAVVVRAICVCNVMGWVVHCAVFSITAVRARQPGRNDVRVAAAARSLQVLLKRGCYDMMFV